MKKQLALLAVSALMTTFPLISNAASDYTVVVKADKAVEEAKQESQKVTIITQKEIEDKQAKTAEDIVFNETGVSRTVDGMGRVGVSIRGAEARHTLILVDGQPALGEFAKYLGAADELSRIGTENVERIEIIQGAASSKYGADAIGGVVNVITKKASKKPKLQFNIEGRHMARDVKGVQKAPFADFFLRADSGAMGKARFSIYGSQRDVMPVVSNEGRKQVSLLFAKDTSDFPENSLRYFGTSANAGVMGTYDIDKNNKIEFRVDHFNEDLHRFIKHSNSDMEPMTIFKRKADRNNYNISYSGRKGDLDWHVEGNLTRIKENDIALTTDFGANTYDGKNTLNSVDNIDHSQGSIKASVNKLVNDNHLLTVGFGFSKEDGTGSRLKSAPETYLQKIDPWDYDKSLYVDPPKFKEYKKPKSEMDVKVASRIHAYKYSLNDNGVLYWDVPYEWYGYDKTKASSYMPAVTYEEYVANDQFQGTGWNLTAEERARRDAMNDVLYKENKAVLDKNPIFNSNRSSMKDNLVRAYYGGGNVELGVPLTLNGKTFKEEYNKRTNSLLVGTASIKKAYFTIQDLWQFDDNTTINPIIRFDHSDKFGGNISASLGVTHNWKGDPNTRIKANIGTGYAEPGMGELYYNWEMYGSNPTGFGFARMGWYWIGNPNLKPEKSLNMDIGFEKEMKRTSIKASLFHNKIDNYLTLYFTGSLMDFSPWIKNNTADAFWKFLYAPDMIYSFKNIGKAEITGLDFEVKQKLGKHWTARLGYTYLNALNKSDALMPDRLLDKPRHKIDFGLNYEDQKRGWNGSLWSNYYVDMLDSNTLANGGNILETFGWGQPDAYWVTHIKAGKEKQEYQKKTYSIWNVMLQKKLDKDSLIYFGVDNIFNHRDDNRALQEKTYRFGVNFKLDNAFETKAAIDTKTGKPMEAKVEPFITRPFDEHKGKGHKLIGEVRVQNTFNLGENRPSALVTPTQYVTARKNMRDSENGTLETRLMLGVDSRIGENTNLTVLASGTAKQDSDKTVNGDDSMKKIKLEKADLTKHGTNWDLSIGRLQEKLGTTGYYFDKQYDGLRAVYTGNKWQVRVGAGSFKHSTGVADTAYTRAVRMTFKRPAYLEEFLGLQRNDSGFINVGSLYDVPNANENVGFVKQLFDTSRKGGSTADLIKILRRMQEQALKAYGNNPKFLNSGEKEKRYLSYQAMSGHDININLNDAAIKFKGKDGEHYFGDFFAVSKQPDYTSEGNVYTFDNPFLDYFKDNYDKTNAFRIRLDDPYLFKDDTEETFFTSWWNHNGDNFVDQLQNALRAAKKDDTITIETPKKEIFNLLKKNLFDTMDRSRQLGVEGSEVNWPNVLTAFVSSMNYALEYVDDGALLPRDALASTGYFVPVEGTVLENDEIPALEKAFYVQGKLNVTDKIGLTAWTLQSFGDRDLAIRHANVDTNEVYNFKKYANVFGVGAHVQLNKASAIDIDAGANFAGLGRHFNGQTLYDHPEGTSTFTLKGYKEGYAPKFWTVRLSVGAADMNVPGSWSAFADYKYFEHGAFFGGTGAQGLPDRYLDGIKSYTVGGSYVPARDWRIDAFYTLGAKGIKQRDTLFGPENFKLGNLTRVQVTYKF